MEFEIKMKNICCLCLSVFGCKCAPAPALRPNTLLNFIKNVYVNFTFI